MERQFTIQNRLGLHARAAAQLVQLAGRFQSECTITKDDIVIPSHCPVLGIPLFQTLGKKGGGDHSPSLDKVRPELGYVPGNVPMAADEDSTQQK